MSLPRSPTLIAAVLTASLTASCAAPRPKPAPPTPITAPPPTGALPLVATPPPVDPPMSIEEARTLGAAWNVAWSNDPNRLLGGGPAFLVANGIDEPTARRVLEALMRDCLAERSSEAAPCTSLGPTSRTDPMVETAIELVGESADAKPGMNPTLRLLVRLEARGAWRAGMAIERVLERRWLAGQQACSPPTAADIDAARARLVDVRIRVPKGAPRAATEAEIADIAYLRAALARSGTEVGRAKEDEASPALSKGSPELARRDVQRKAMDDALLDGDIVRHAAASEAYLKMLGYPGPIRVREETDQRWGGAGFSYALRQWARSAEILGRYEVAEPLHRRAAPGGGMCGTSTPTVLATQMEGSIRVAEQREGCRPVVAERLFSPQGDRDDPYGAAKLQAAGFDVARLYRAALLETNDVDWSARIRAISGYAEFAGRDAVARLVEIAESDELDRRIDALQALEGLLQSYGLDPCVPSRVGYGHGSSGGEREVTSIMTKCETRLDDKARDEVVRRVAALASDSDPTVREVVAKMLGVTASPVARAPLEKLARDEFDAGGRVCTQTGGGPERCEPNKPVKRAAKEGLIALAKADEVRRTQAKAARAKK